MLSLPPTLSCRFSLPLPCPLGHSCQDHDLVLLCPCLILGEKRFSPIVCLQRETEKGGGSFLPSTATGVGQTNNVPSFPTLSCMLITRVQCCHWPAAALGSCCSRACRGCSKLLLSFARGRPGGRSKACLDRPSSSFCLLFLSRPSLRASASLVWRLAPQLSICAPPDKPYDSWLP